MMSKRCSINSKEYPHFSVFTADYIADCVTSARKLLPVNSHIKS